MEKNGVIFVIEKLLFVNFFKHFKLFGLGLTFRRNSGLNREKTTVRSTHLRPACQRPSL